MTKSNEILIYENSKERKITRKMKKLQPNLPFELKTTVYLIVRVIEPLEIVMWQWIEHENWKMHSVSFIVRAFFNMNDTSFWVYCSLWVSLHLICHFDVSFHIYWIRWILRKEYNGPFRIAIGLCMLVATLTEKKSFLLIVCYYSSPWCVVCAL